jgi:hypothetical protein
LDFGESASATFTCFDAGLRVSSAFAGTVADGSGAAASEDGSAPAAFKFACFESAASLDGPVASAEAASAVDVTVVAAETEAVKDPAAGAAGPPAGELEPGASAGTAGLFPAD